MGYKVAVVGATGNVGREMLNILDERKFPADEVVALAQGLGSRRVVSQLGLLYRRLDRWRQDPAVAAVRGRLKVLVDSFKPEREAG